MATFRLLAALDSPAPSTLDSLIAAVADHPADPAYRLVLANLSAWEPR
jgi:hypothetical protein